MPEIQAPMAAQEETIPQPSVTSADIVRFQLSTDQESAITVSTEAEKEKQLMILLAIKYLT